MNMMKNQKIQNILHHHLEEKNEDKKENINKVKNIE
jgi:hypothetical protein